MKPEHYVSIIFLRVQWAKDLLELKTYLCGTLRQIQLCNTPELMQKKLKNGEIYGQQSESSIRVSKWMDNRQVFMISSVPSRTVVLEITTKRGKEVQKSITVIA